MEAFFIFRSFGAALPGLVSAESLFSLAGVTPPERGLGGRLEVRTPILGGWGKALMLICFRIVFPPIVLGVVRNFGRAVVGAGVTGGVCTLEGARSPLLGSGVLIFESERVGMAPVLFLVLVVGSAGKADVGGP